MVRTMEAQPAVHGLRIFTIFFVLTVGLVGLGEAQAQRNATTDPAEERAINEIFWRWRISAGDRWNVSGELCSGTALDETSLTSPGIKCDCAYKNGTVCHITSLMVSSTSDLSNVVGPLPNELWSLTYLTTLNLAKNYLTGPLSPSVGNLTRMQYLSLGINALSGKLPDELGKLTHLKSFRLDSSGISGEIPPAFAKLRKMKIVFATDIALTGRIPDFIGSWSQLTTLRFHGTSLQGPIPSTFSNLTALTDLRISDLSNGSSPLNFLRNMRSLTTLILRNNNISDSIPSNLNELRSLSLVDLSFNSFSGQLPEYLFKMASLVHLFLGNNRLTGSLPMLKTPILQFIDLSYNQLSGSFPSWVSEQNLQLVLSSGLNCLQRNFPCNRGHPQYFSFAIKCGGPQVKSAMGILYEPDNEDLGPAAYFVTREQRWAVSNVGFPSDSKNPEYKSYIQQYVPNTRDPELFRDARFSAGSLRYYGLGLQNGGYNVSLQFVEAKFENNQVWQSLGRRVFDIYVQGNLVFKDFDIRKEANGSSYRAVVKDVSAMVTENHLEIHLFWAGKGTCCVPGPATYGPSISAISVAPGDFTASNKPPNEPGNKNRGHNAWGIMVLVAVICTPFVITIICVVERRKKQTSYEDDEFLGIEARPYTFDYAELKAATDDFCGANKLGEGGFGPVYKGKLKDGRNVAVKQLSVASHQGKSQFVAEIATISSVQHRNLVKLYGCCIEGEKRLLVYEYLENRSLDQALFGNKNLFLDWPTRFDICLGVGRGLAYLHEESRLRIVHRDVKASNILLDSEFKQKISDFGLAKLYDDKKTHISTRIAGTIGYLAPEYAMRGHLTEKADVFGFGVLALEIVSGRANFDPSLERNKTYLLEWAWHCQENELEMELVDKCLSEFNEEKARRVIGVAFLCSQTSPSARPSMSRVVAMLSGDIGIPSVTSKPAYLTEWNFSDTSTFVTAISNQSATAEESSSGGITLLDTAATTPPAPYSPHAATEPILQGMNKEGRQYNYWSNIY